MSRRKSIPPSDQTSVLISSARRCCLCFGLKNDSEPKKGQIAHLDHDPFNPDPDNLAWLCFDHHNEYDSRQSQGKGFTIQEVREYRDRLIEFLAVQSESAIPMTIPNVNNGSTTLEGNNNSIFGVYMPIRLQPGIGNAYLRNLYLNLPVSDSRLNNIPFLITRKTLYFDTNEQIRYYLPRQDGGKEIELQLTEPIANVKKVHFLINSGNSKSVYAGRKIGEISLRFGNVHPFTIDLILGHNIREWAVGNQGDLVREFADSSVQQAWQGMNRQGNNAVMDHLEITIPEVIQNAILEKIVFVHLPTHHATDSLGVHYLVLAVTIEVG